MRLQDLEQNHDSCLDGILVDALSNLEEVLLGEALVVGAAPVVG